MTLIPSLQYHKDYFGCYVEMDVSGRADNFVYSANDTSKIMMKRK